jgi:hypothetical protein
MQIKLVSHLVSMSVTANDDWFRPGGNQTGNVFANDGFPEDSAAEDVTDGAIGRLPHLLQFELYINKMTISIRK